MLSPNPMRGAMPPVMFWSAAAIAVMACRAISAAEPPRVLARLVDPLGLLAESQAWTPERRQAYRAASCAGAC